jgi:RNA polymerase sigma-70 factor, ECF subfamily
MTQFLHQRTEEELIRSAQQGERESYDRLYDQHHDNVYRFIFSRLRNHLDTEDIVQEVFLRAWLNIKKYQEHGIPFSHYLSRIAHNMIIDFHRKNQRVIFVDDLDNNSAQDETGELLNLHMDLQNLNIFFCQIPEDYQKVLSLRYLIGMTPQETALIMRRSEVATRILQHRALRSIRELVKTSEN